MSMAGDLGAPTPEFLAWLDSTSPHSGKPAQARKSCDPPIINDDDGINPIVAIAAYEYFSSGDGS